MSPGSSKPLYRWLDRIKSEGGPHPYDRLILIVLGGWFRDDEAWSHLQPTIVVLARQTGLCDNTVKERLQRMDGVWFDRKKAGRGYRYRLRFPTAEELAAMASISEFRSSRKGHQFVSQSANGNRDTKSGERDTNSHPIKGHQLASPRPIPKRLDRAPAREADVSHARQALADRGENPYPNDDLHPCARCGKKIGEDATMCVTCHLDMAGVHLDASRAGSPDQLLPHTPSVGAHRSVVGQPASKHVQKRD